MKQNSSQWMPFNSLFNGNEEKDKIVVINKKKPILSEEQIEAIENKIIEAFTEQVPVIIIHFHKYDFIESIGIITKIDSIKKTITLNHNEIIYFINIIKIFIKNT